MLPIINGDDIGCCVGGLTAEGIAGGNPALIPSPDVILCGPACGVLFAATVHVAVWLGRFGRNGVDPDTDGAPPPTAPGRGTEHTAAP